MAAFSYDKLFEAMMPHSPGAYGPVFMIGGTFTNAQSGGSSMPLGTDHGATKVLLFLAANETDPDETVQIDRSSNPTVSITTVTNDDDGTWFAVITKGGWG